MVRQQSQLPHFRTNGIVKRPFLVENIGGRFILLPHGVNLNLHLLNERLVALVERLLPLPLEQSGSLLLPFLGNPSVELFPVDLELDHLGRELGDGGLNMLVVLVLLGNLSLELGEFGLLLLATARCREPFHPFFFLLGFLELLANRLATGFFHGKLAS